MEEITEIGKLQSKMQCEVLLCPVKCTVLFSQSSLLLRSGYTLFSDWGWGLPSRSW